MFAAFATLRQGTWIHRGWKCRPDVNLSTEIEAETEAFRPAVFRAAVLLVAEVMDVRPRASSGEDLDKSCMMLGLMLHLLCLGAAGRACVCSSDLSQRETGELRNMAALDECLQGVSVKWKHKPSEVVS